MHIRFLRAQWIYRNIVFQIDCLFKSMTSTDCQPFFYWADPLGPLWKWICFMTLTLESRKWAVNRFFADGRSMLLMAPKISMWSFQVWYKIITFLLGYQSTIYRNWAAWQTPLLQTRQWWGEMCTAKEMVSLVKKQASVANSRSRRRESNSAEMITATVWGAGLAKPGEKRMCSHPLEREHCYSIYLESTSRVIRSSTSLPTTPIS